MPNIDQKELERIAKRLNFLYEELDGQKKQKSQPKDEFSRIQTSLKQQLIQLRNLINRHKNCSTHDVINKRKVEVAIRQELFSAEQDYSQLENYVQKNMRNKKLSEKEKENQQKILEKMGNILRQVKNSFMQTNKNEYNRTNQIKLKDLNDGNIKNNKYINFDEDDEDDLQTDREGDDQIIKEWQKKDEILDEKLEDVIVLLDEIQVMNKNLQQEIEVRDKLVLEGKNKVMKVNQEISKQHKQLQEILKKYREPKKLCMDFCMCLLLVGLIGVIIMLIKNGKQFYNVIFQNYKIF